MKYVWTSSCRVYLFIDLLSIFLILLFPLFMQHSFRMEDGVGHVYAKGNGMH